MPKEKKHSVLNPLYPSSRLSNYQYIPNLFFLCIFTPCHQIILEQLPDIMLFHL